VFGILHWGTGVVSCRLEGKLAMCDGFISNWMLAYVQVRKDEIWLKFCEDFHGKLCDERQYNVQFTFSRSVASRIIQPVLDHFRFSS